jgi:hypothetical protein
MEVDFVMSGVWVTLKEGVMRWMTYLSHNVYYDYLV